MKKLKLPPTIRNLLEEDVPNTPSILREVKKLKDANIAEGFVFTKMEDAERAYKFYAEINIDNDLLWLLVREFIITMPSEVALIYGNVDDAPHYGVYLDKYALIEKLESYSLELAQDGFLEFGILFDDGKRLEEVFVKKSKWLQYWGIDEEVFMSLMEKFDLSSFEKLNFVDEFPMVTESLIMLNPSVKETSQIINELNEVFLPLK